MTFMYKCTFLNEPRPKTFGFNPLFRLFLSDDLLNLLVEGALSELVEHAKNIEIRIPVQS